MIRIAWLVLAGAFATAVVADEWPQFRGPRRDGVWRETGVVQKFDAAQLTPKWRAPVSSGYSSPTVAGGRVYLMDRQVEPQQQERLLCFDADSGRSLWTFAYPRVYRDFSYPDGPRASVTVHDGRAYAVGAMGDFHCLDAVTGKLLWKRDCLTDYQIRMPDWGIAADPLLDGEQVVLHLGGVNACVVAFDRKSGREVWRALPDRAGYAAPTPITHAGHRLLVVWTGERLAALESGTGKLRWEYPYPASVRIGAAVSPAVYRDFVFISSWYDGALLLRLKPDELAVEKVWHRKGPNERNTEAFHQLMTNPLFIDEHIYGIDTYGEFRCLDLRNGERVWESQEVTPRARNSGVHFIRNADRWFAFNERGQLIICKLSPQGYQELSRTQLIKPTLGQFSSRQGVVWSHPAFAYRHVFARNDEELICVSLAAQR